MRAKASFCLKLLVCAPSNRRVYLLSFGKKEDRNTLFKKELFYLELTDFIGLAQIVGINIYTKDEETGKETIRRDFQKIEEEMLEFYDKLNRKTQNLFLKRIRQITSYNKKKLKQLQTKKEKENNGSDT